jgi:hypothetical protein
MKKTKNSRLQNNPADKHLALISVILGAASFFNTIFTGIPAIIVGIIALRKKAGDPVQAKLGILFGIIGSLLIIPIVWLAIHFLRAPITEQTSIPSTDSQRILAIEDALRSYKEKHGKYPECYEGNTDQNCNDWSKFRAEHPDLHSYPMEFETSSYTVEDRPIGTLVLAYKTDCFVNTPADPEVLDDDEDLKRLDPDDHAALVFFHNGGRSCYSIYKN